MPTLAVTTSNVGGPNGIAISSIASRMRSAVVCGLKWLAGEGDQELFASVPICRITESAGFLQGGADRPENLVAGEVAEGVVVPLEVVEIEERDREDVAVAFGPRGPLGHVLVEPFSITQACQVVATGIVEQRRVETLEFCSLMRQAAM